LCQSKPLAFVARGLWVWPVYVVQCHVICETDDPFAIAFVTAEIKHTCCSLDDTSAMVTTT
jgi:hypothetical protein